MDQDTSITNLREEPGATSRSALSLRSIILVAIILLVITFFGIALTERSRTQLTSGPAPDFALATYDGGHFQLSEQLGKVVVINFWASWCIPCRTEAPVLQATWERYRDHGVVLVGVDYLDPETDARAFLKEFGITYPNGPDIGTKISVAYRTQGIPETFVVDQDGKVAKFLYGGVTEAQLQTVIDGLLANS